MFEEQLLSLYDMCLNLCNFNIEKFHMKERTDQQSLLTIQLSVSVRIQSFLIGFLSNFMYGLLPSMSGSSVNTGCIRRAITKIATAYQFGCCGLSNLSHFNWISLEFHIWIASIKLWFKFGYRFYPTNDSQDGLQNGRHLSVLLLWSLLLSQF